MNVNGYGTKAAAMRDIKAAGFSMASLLSKPEANPKVAKNAKLGVLSSPLHLAPARLSGFEVCAQRSVGCTAACLHTAGNPAHMPGKTLSRIAKTQAYFRVRKAFVAVLAFEIDALHRKAVSLNMETGVRLNATSDIPWEAVALTVDGINHNNLMSVFGGVSFYDYTKIKKRALKAATSAAWPFNYHLTYSKTEENSADCAEVLDAGGNVAMVFDHKADKPAAVVMSVGEMRPRDIRVKGSWEVIDGDLHDYRPADPKGGVIVGLKAKGDARNDQSGFVVR